MMLRHQDGTPGSNRKKYGVGSDVTLEGEDRNELKVR
jgi:hypothetical protein